MIDDIECYLKDKKEYTEKLYISKKIQFEHMRIIFDKIENFPNYGDIDVIEDDILMALIVNEEYSIAIEQIKLYKNRKLLDEFLILVDVIKNTSDLYQRHVIINDMYDMIYDTEGKAKMMVQEDGVWTYSCELSEGIYHYKFLVNDKLPLNDPMADCYKRNDQDSWSVLVIDHKGNKVTKGKDSVIQLLDYCLSTSCNQDIQQFSKKIFDITVFDKVVARFLFGKVKGMHFITIAWYDPYDQLYEYTENHLNTKDEPVVQWFWLSLCPGMAEGKWTMHLFIDGVHVLDDKFELFNIKNSANTGNVSFFI